MDKPEKVNLSHLVTERIKSFILDRELKEGDKLPSEKQLVESLEVSRTVVREALKSLELLGIVKIKTGDGIYVDGLSLKPILDQMSFRWKQSETRMKELWATRRILELGAVEMAIKHYDLDLISQMEEWNEAFNRKIALQQVPSEEDLQFHRTLFKATGNHTYFEFSEVLTDFFINIRQLHFGSMEGMKLSLLEHRTIVKRIREKDMAGAKREMDRHLRPLRRYIDQ
ncbi:FadR/GntR family transcriptional regulator [Paenibacillus aurantius]|uniref:FadR/GntR family transcriptional regulator n=1 Tax=Paenibacillus aurantius TaxID=2918900 RepID=A0AA96LJJ6_9BACL|nr:FadR/GntR family transcriptional regulator [Paenibacillus aurantius]WJH32852.1 FadR family transcriptional regulator [Paenibacillus sp. CC-CFT747]WNQ13261.1 FadR/GntR family transcriptional regulator [Paenibacillus aurantius]